MDTWGETIPTWNSLHSLDSVSASANGTSDMRRGGQEDDARV
jgi:hypothetical protein